MRTPGYAQHIKLKEYNSSRNNFFRPSIGGNQGLNQIDVKYSYPIYALSTRNMLQNNKESNCLNGNHKIANCTSEFVGYAKSPSNAQKSEEQKKQSLHESTALKEVLMKNYKSLLTSNPHKKECRRNSITNIADLAKNEKINSQRSKILINKRRKSQINPQSEVTEHVENEAIQTSERLKNSQGYRNSLVKNYNQLTTHNLRKEILRLRRKNQNPT